jgi:hypothetical protein
MDAADNIGVMQSRTAPVSSASALPQTSVSCAQFPELGAYIPAVSFHSSAPARACSIVAATASMALGAPQSQRSDSETSCRSTCLDAMHATGADPVPTTAVRGGMVLIQSVKQQGQSPHRPAGRKQSARDGRASAHRRC